MGVRTNAHFCLFLCGIRVWVGTRSCQTASLLLINSQVHVYNNKYCLYGTYTFGNDTTL